MFARHTLRAIIKALGFILLDNEMVLLTKGKEILQLVGLSDTFSQYFGIKRHVKELFLQINPHQPTLLLAHQPKDFSYTQKLPLILQLSGHTHGGQIYPLSYIVRLFQPFIQGLHQKNGRQIYVSSGYGCWGMKMRFLVPSEVPLITLKRCVDA